MIRLTTPQHVFTFPQNPSEYNDILVTMTQKGQIILEKTKSDMEFNPEKKQASYRLSQEETKLFNAHDNVKLQVRVLSSGNDAYASEIFILDVKDVLNDSIMDGDST